ncbi:hypothetical protein O3802_00875 [Gemella sp. 27098_8_92]|uniref:hypothetical protein n=1 Tax=Gemella sp. 27098_8_92 TaxID=3003687 RepID=UPI00352E7FDA
MNISKKITTDLSGKIISIEYKEIETNDVFLSEDEEPIRNEIINILAKHNLPYWKAKLILERTTAFLVKEAVVQNIT